MNRITRVTRTFRARLKIMLSNRYFAMLVALFILLSLCNLVLTLIRLHIPGSTDNPMVSLFATHNAIVASLVWVALTLFVATNMIIAFPGAPTWARREALLFCILLAFVLAHEIWIIVPSLTR